MASASDLQGKRVLVVGGETDLGRAVAVGLAEAGVDVAIASLSPESKAEFAINSALNELWAMGRQGLALAIDAGDEDQLRQAVGRAASELGPLDLAAAVTEEGGGGTLDALRKTLGGAPAVAIQPDTSLAEALDLVLAEL